jgi:hypothetical protein
MVDLRIIWCYNALYSAMFIVETTMNCNKIFTKFQGGFRKMKKTLSLVLALVMILGSFSTVFAAEPVTTEAEAGAFLKAAGVLVGDEKGDLNLKDNLLRQDAVILVAQLRGEIEVAKNFPTLPTYEDVKIKFYNAPLAWAQEKDLFVGHSEKVFGFNEDLTAQEYAKVLLCALGYKVAPNGDSDIKWAEVLDKAEEFGILENLKVENSTKITRGEMALMTFNALGVNMKGLKKTLAETLNIEMPVVEAKELKAEVKDTENLKEVKVELSNAKLAEAEKLANKDNYRVDKFKVVRATVDGNDVILELDKALVKNRAYDLTVRNIDKAINKKYSFKANDNASPRVEEVESLGEYGIKVTLSEPVDNPLERNFLVDGKNIAMNLESYGRVLILTPYHKTAFSANAEKLTIKELEDFAGYKSALEDFEIKVVKDEVAPKVTDVIVKGNVVEVTFDKDVYADSVEGYVNRKDVGNISYRSGRQTIYTIEEKTDGTNYGNKIDTNKVSYVFKDNLPRATEVTIEGVQNHSKVTMEKVDLVAKEIKDNLEPEIIDTDVDATVSTGVAEITLEFDKNVYGNLNRAADHFALYTEDVSKRNEVLDYTISAAYKQDNNNDDIKNIIIVTIGNLKENLKDKRYDYILEVFNFEDSSRNRMFRDYVEFELKAGKTLVVEDIQIKEGKNETVVTIDFNYAVDRVRAEDLTNYLFRTKAGNKAKDVKDLDGEIIVSRNGKTVTIELPDFDYDAYKENGLFEILEGVRDKDGTKLAGKVVYEFETNYKGEISKIAATAAVVKAEASKTQVDVDAAKVLVTALPAGTDKTDLEGRLTDVQVIIDAAASATETEKIKTATAAVVVAETNRIQVAVDAAKVLVNGLQDGATKTALEGRIAVIQAEINATAAVVKAETSNIQVDVDAAKALVTVLPAGATKTALEGRITAVQVIIDAAEAEVALVEAKVELKSAIDAAQELHDGATEGSASGEYTTGSKATLLSAITAATTSHDDASSSETVATINQAKADLGIAVATFRAAKVQ